MKREYGHRVTPLFCTSPPFFLVASRCPPGTISCIERVKGLARLLCKAIAVLGCVLRLYWFLWTDRLAGIRRKDRLEVKTDGEVTKK